MKVDQIKVDQIKVDQMKVDQMKVDQIKAKPLLNPVNPENLVNPVKLLFVWLQPESSLVIVRSGWQGTCRRKLKGRNGQFELRWRLIAKKKPYVE